MPIEIAHPQPVVVEVPARSHFGLVLGILDIMKGLAPDRTRMNSEVGGPETQWVPAAAQIGIAVIVIACGAARAQAPPLAVECSHPAPIENHLNPEMPNLMVLIRKDVDIFSIASRIASTYAVQPRVLPAIRMLMLTPVTEALVERLRCEPDIELLSYDAPVSTN